MRFSEGTMGHPRLSLTYIVENLNVHTAERVFGNDSGSSDDVREW
jgi:hypothetical protein